MNPVIQSVVDAKGNKRFKVYSPDVNAPPYVGDAVDCREMMELHKYTTEPPQPQKELIPAEVETTKATDKRK